MAKLLVGQHDITKDLYSCRIHCLRVQLVCLFRVCQVWQAGATKAEEMQKGSVCKGKRDRKRGKMRKSVGEDRHKDVRD